MYFLFLFDPEEKIWITDSHYDTKNQFKKNFERDINYDADKLGLSGSVLWKIIKANSSQEDDAYSSDTPGGYSIDVLINSGATVIESGTYELKIDEGFSDSVDSDANASNIDEERVHRRPADSSDIERLAIKEAKNGWGKLFGWGLACICSGLFFVGSVGVYFKGESETVWGSIISMVIALSCATILFVTIKNRSDVRNRIKSLSSEELSRLNEVRAAIKHLKKIQSLRGEVASLHDRIAQSSDARQIGQLRGRLAHVESELRQMGG